MLELDFPISTDIVQALQHTKPPARFKKSGPVVRAIAKLAEDVRQFGGYPRASGASALDQFDKRLDDVGRGFRGGLRDIWFVGGVKEIAEKDKIGEYIAALFDWFEHTPTGHPSVPGVALLHQELMHLCPYQQRSIDALTRCLLMQRHVNRSGIGVIERRFVKDAEQYANAISDVATALGSKASNLRMVQRDLARLAELGLIEKVGARKDAWYRALSVSTDADLDPPETPEAAIGVRIR